MSANDNDENPENIYERARQRSGCFVMSWKALHSASRIWCTALIEEARALGPAATVPDADLCAECEKLLRFVAGLDLRTCSLADQRERRERVHAMQRAMRVLK